MSRQRLLNGCSYFISTRTLFLDALPPDPDKWCRDGASAVNPNLRQDQPNELRRPNKYPHVKCAVFFHSKGRITPTAG
jgi:hypothetical protein